MDWLTKVHLKPAYYDRHRSVCAHRDQEQSGVLKLCVVVYRYQNAKSSNGNTDSKECKAETMASSVRSIGNHHCKSERGGPGWHTVELRTNVRIPVCLDDTGCEIGISYLRISGVSDRILGWILPYAGTMSPKYMKPPIQSLRSLKTLPTSRAEMLRSRAEAPWSACSRAFT